MFMAILLWSPSILGILMMMHHTAAFSGIFFFFFFFLPTPDGSLGIEDIIIQVRLFPTWTLLHFPQAPHAACPVSVNNIMPFNAKWKFLKVWLVKLCSWGVDILEGMSFIHGKFADMLLFISLSGIKKLGNEVKKRIDGILVKEMGRWVKTDLMQTVSAVLRRRDRVQRKRVIDSQYVCVCLPIRAGLSLQQRHCNCLDCQTSQRSSCHCCWLDQRALCLSVSLSPLHMQNFRIWFFFYCHSLKLSGNHLPTCMFRCLSVSLFVSLLLNFCALRHALCFSQINKSGPMWSVCFQHLLYHLDAQHCTAANPRSTLIHPMTPLHLQSLYLQPRKNTTVSADKQHNPTWWQKEWFDLQRSFKNAKLKIKGWSSSLRGPLKDFLCASYSLIKLKKQRKR